jgi:subtilisin-like proprotein convertase family protein
MANVATATIQHLSDFVLTTPVEVTTEDVFAVVEVMRNFIQVSGLEVMRSDAVFCRFDAVVGDEPDTPLQAGGASFGEWDLVWSTDSYEYIDAVNLEFLTLGEDYALVVTASDDVPAMNVDVGMVDDEVYITNLAVGADVALGGFTLEWGGSSLGSTVEVLMTSPEAGGMSMTLPNTGSYTFTEGELATVTSGTGHILLSWEQEEPLVAEGYDEDSIVRQFFTCLCSVNFTEEVTLDTVLYTETPNLSIPDATRGGPGTPVTDTISVTESGALAGLRVYLSIIHGYSSDLIVKLTSPEGTQLRLFWIGEGGEPNTDPAGWYPDDFTPKDDFAGFYGEDINGTWTITAQDMSYDAPGTLVEWRMEFTYGQ